MGGCWRLGRVAIGLALMSAVGACTAFDPMDSRGETLNRSAGDYANDAILMNIVRSQLYEPLSFVTITGVTGVSSVTGSLGFGGFTLGPAKPPLTYLLGPDSASRTNSNSFNISVVDDPASFAALLAPVNPAIIGFFINQGYPRELLFFLFTDHVRQVEEDANGRITKVVNQYFNDPNNNTSVGFGSFIAKMGTLLHQGLTAEVDITTTPTGRSLPPSKLCLDPSLPEPGFAANAPVPPALAATSNVLCENAPWIASQSAPSAGSASGGSGSSASAGVSNMTVAANGTLWALLAGQNEILQVTPNGTMKQFALPAAPKPSKKPSEPGLAAYEFTDGGGNHYQLFTRSTYGAYEYIGALLRNKTDIDNLLGNGPGYNGIIRVDAMYGGNCFAAVAYRSEPYCVPADAWNTKRVFALLHQLQQLNTAPSNTPTTLTVTPIN